MNDNYGLPTKFVFHTGSPHGNRYYVDLEEHRGNCVLLQNWNDGPVGTKNFDWEPSEIADYITKGSWVIDFVIEENINAPELEDLL